MVKHTLNILQHLLCGFLTCVYPICESTRLGVSGLFFSPKYFGFFLELINPNHLGSSGSSDVANLNDGPIQISKLIQQTQ